MLQASTAGAKISYTAARKKNDIRLRRIYVCGKWRTICLETVERLYFHPWVWIVCRFKIERPSKTLLPLLLKYLTPGFCFVFSQTLMSENVRSSTKG